MLDGRTFVDPSNAELARGYGAMTEPEGGEFDVVIVGVVRRACAGGVRPVGRVAGLVVERESIGGQAGRALESATTSGLPGRERRRARSACVPGMGVRDHPLPLMRDVTGLQSNGGDHVLTDLRTAARSASAA